MTETLLSQNLWYIERNPNITILRILSGYMKPSTQSTVVSNFWHLWFKPNIAGILAFWYLYFVGDNTSFGTAEKLMLHSLITADQGIVPYLFLTFLLASHYLLTRSFANGTTFHTTFWEWISDNYPAFSEGHFSNES